ncbi:MAG: cobalamin-binding protein [Planctomycetota bacterium]
MRIASLLPSATEIVAIVGGRDELVGVSHECDYPAGVDRLPVLTRTRRELPKASGEIDREVRAILTDALTVYEIELDVLRKAAPDVIVTQDLCDVCAVSLDDVRRALAELVREDVKVVSLSPSRLADVWNDVRRVGEGTGHASEGEAAVRELERRISELRARTSAFDARPSVLTVEWIDPVMIGGTWMPELVEIAGGHALVTEPGQHAPTLGLDELRALDPDVVLVKPCGFDLERTATEADLLRKTLPWDQWTAAREGRVFVADGNAYFNRPGPRLVESAEILAACIHPDACADLAASHAGSFYRLTADATWQAVH